MVNSRFARGAAQCAAALLLALLLPGVAVTPVSAKKTSPLEKHVTSPVRLALSSQGELLLSDYQSQSILVIDQASLLVTYEIKIKGRPAGVAGEGQKIFVGNESTGNIEVYSQAGKLLESWGDGAIGLPNDIEIDQATGRLFVVDTQGHQLRIFGANGQSLGSIPAAGVAEQLYHPTALALDRQAQLVYVSDQGPSVNSLSFSNRSAFVRIYRYDGTYVDTLSGAFTRPQGLTINPDGYLFLADGMRGQILVFDLLSKGLIKTIGTPGSGPGQLSLPLDVVINPLTGDLLVTNNRAGRLEIFTGGGLAP